ncbi:retrovirus-related pol polyprotein from transposon 17.6 [Tanacetum coccineum]
MSTNKDRIENLETDLSQQKKTTRPTNKSTYDLTSASRKSPSPIKRLTWDEMQKRRSQGLCINYDTKFMLGHKCSGPQLLLLGANDEENEVDEEDACKFGYDETEISLHALTGWETTRTMRVYARIGPYLLVVLIDTGTHNFINEKVAEMLSIPVVPTKPFNVKVANGLPLSWQGRFENMEVLLQGIPFSLSLYYLPLIGLDMVLGVQWLE